MALDCPQDKVVSAHPVSSGALQPGAALAPTTNSLLLSFGFTHVVPAPHGLLYHKGLSWASSLHREPLSTSHSPLRNSSPFSSKWLFLKSRVACDLCIIPLRPGGHSQPQWAGFQLSLRGGEHVGYQEVPWENGH